MDYYKNQSYYDILGVTEDATLESIEKAKNRLKFGDAEDRAPFNMWDKIDEAYKVLTNREARSEYDKKLEMERKNISSFSPISSDHVFEDIYSNKNHESSSILSSSEEVMESDIIPKLKKAGKNLVLAIPTAVLATITIIKELNPENDYVVEKSTTEKEIKEPQTEDSRLEEFYRKKIEEQINQKMNEYHYNYDLQIEKVRLENRIELLKQKISQKENQVVKKLGLLKYKLELTSLKNQLEAFYRCLEKVEEKINEVNNNRNKQKLTRMNDKLFDVNKKIKELSDSPKEKIFALKKLEAKKASITKARKTKIQKQIKSIGNYAVFKESFVSAYARTENFVENLFVPMDKIDEKNKIH
ncbi:MAG: hypothetical protein IJE04_01135 [Bacilli bacterium]|nr:hypothetical protein [Bacilli bacterium]